MFSFIDSFFDSPRVKILSITILIILCICAPYLITWFESTSMGQLLIESGIWPDNMTLWPYEEGFKLLTLGSIGVILSFYFGIAMVLIWLLIMTGLFIVCPTIILYRKFKELKGEWAHTGASTPLDQVPQGYRKKGNGKMVPIKKDNGRE